MSTAWRDGLYKVEISGFGRSSSGVVVLSGSRLLGGDCSHYFTGSLTEEGGQIRAEIQVDRHSEQASLAFGPLSSARLALVGRLPAGVSRLTLIGAAEEVRAVAIQVCLTPLLVDTNEPRVPLTGAG